MADKTPLQEEKKNSALTSLEIGAFEIIFVVVGLLLIFGVLNYFNILSIGKAIPALSFLPTQKQEKQAPAANINAEPTKAAPTKRPTKLPPVYYTPVPES